MAFTNAQLIAELYIGYYDRAPDPTGLNFWLYSLNQGISLATIANDFANSGETTAVYPFLLNPTAAGYSAFITSVYANILNRNTDAAGAAFWLNQLQTRQITPGGFILAIEDSVNMQSGTPDALTLQNKTAVGLDYYSRISAANVPFNGVSAVLLPVTSDPITVQNAEDITSAIIAAGKANILASIDFKIGAVGGSFNGPSLTNANPTGQSALNKVALFSDFYGLALTATGYDTVYLVSPGGIQSAAGIGGGVSFTALSGQSLVVNIVGSQNVDVAQSIDLSGATTAIEITNKGATELFPTNAQVIDATFSGGLIIDGPGTGNNGTTGQTIVGSSAQPNTLIGSPGNDTITASLVGGDFITTDGGSDTIKLNNHAVGDKIAFNGFSLVTLGAHFPVHYTPNAAMVDGNDQPQPGYWGVLPSTTSAGAPSASTSADQTIISGFNPGLGANADVLQFTLWVPGLINAGLTFGDGNTSSGGSIVIEVTAPAGLLSAAANAFEITGTTFSNAAALANALSTTYGLTFAGTGVAAGKDAHMLFLYNDADGNAHIADVDFENLTNATSATTTASVSHIVASDMVELLGVSIASLTANNVHLA